MAETVDGAATVSPPDEAEQDRSPVELFERLGREVGELGVAEARLEAARNMPEVRRAARDITGVLVMVIAALTAFAFINVAAMEALSSAMASWLAALVLAVLWLTVVGVLLFGFMGRARQWLTWIAFSAPPTEAVEELEQRRDAAAKTALRTLERLGPVLAAQIALAAVPDAEDIAGGIFEMGDTVLDGVDEVVEEFTEQIPGGRAVNQVWDVVLMPGRFGLKVATTVLQRGRPGDPGGRGTNGPSEPDRGGVDPGRTGPDQRRPNATT